MKTVYLLAHDLGTTGNKATLYSSGGELIASDVYSYHTYYPKHNWVEQNPEDWWKATCISTQRLLEKSRVHPNDVAVISFSGQMMGAVMVDKAGNPLRDCIIWADMRSEKQAADIAARISSEEVYQISGNPISPSYTIEKVMWIRDNQPDIFRQTYKFLHAKDYLVAKLTGRFVTDYTDASGTNTFDLIKQEWSEPLVETTGLPFNIFPEAHPSIAVVGEVTTAASNEVGLRSGTPVVIGAADGCCAAVGAGVVREGSAYNYLGSSSWIALATPKPLLDPKQRTVTFCHVDPNMMMPIATMQCVGGAYQWFKDEVGHIETKAGEDAGISPFELLNLKAESTVPGSHSLLFLPYLLGERTPYWNPNARGAYIGLTRGHTREDLTRAILEGAIFGLRTMVDTFVDQGVQIDEVRVIGGGARGRLFCQIQADIFRRNILRTQLLEEATSLGAAIAGGIGVGIFKDFSVAEELVGIADVFTPRQQEGECYEKLYEIFKESYHALVPIYEKLAALNME
ncbi:xylulokinase [candidate division KSB3 bacterium]|uniref:Xylulose kinase n=1 Tax=candidate division KSB3 bacterium TaxID=2044937 RepID=A0A2G6KGC7_9BACT|nr:MAG: xylulokinase [candidate division KSB3 bacterium]